MKLQVTLFNWLQIHLVSERRPDDRVAKETVQFFNTILQEDHQLSSFRAYLDGANERYVITYWRNETEHTEQFAREAAEKLWRDIEENPKYNE